MAENSDPHVSLRAAEQALNEARMSDAAAHLAAASAAFAREGNRRMQVHALVHLGTTQKRQGLVDAAYATLEAAAEAAQSLDDPLMKGDAFAAFGEFCVDLGRAHAAAKWLRFAIENSIGGNPIVLGRRHTLLGMALKELGDYAHALDEMRAGAALAFFPINAAIAKFHLADLLQLLGLTGEARQLIEETLPTFEQEAIRRFFPFPAISTYLNYGWLLYQAGQRDDGIEWCRRAVAEAAASGSAVAEVVANTRCCDLLHRRGDFAAAYPLASRAALLASNTPGIAPRVAAAACLELSTNHLMSGRQAEAEEALGTARTFAERVDDTVTEYNIAVQELQLASRALNLDRALFAARKAVTLTLAAVSGNPSVIGIIRAMGRHTIVFDRLLDLLAFWAAARRDHGEQSVVRVTRSASGGVQQTVVTVPAASEWEILAVIDAARCAHIREGLARHLASSDARGKHQPWRAGPRPWQQAFRRETVALMTEPGLQRTRGRIPAPADAVLPAPEHVLLPPDAGDGLKHRLCELIREEDVLALIPDSRTVLLQFFFHEHDLWLLPVRRGSTGSAVVVLGDNGLLTRKGALPELRELAAAQTRCITSIHNETTTVDAAHLPAAGSALSSVYERVWVVVGGEEMLTLLEHELGVDRGEIQLVLIPDGPLCELPLHALPVSRDRTRLYDVVKSVRYGLSLRTLSLQQECQARIASRPPGVEVALQGVVFADPDTRGAGPLPGVPDEVRRLADQDPDRWWIHGDSEREEFEASPANFVARHGSGTLLWACGHGARLQPGERESFALQLCGGRVGSAELLTGPFDFSSVELFVLSACWLGRIAPNREAAREIDGYQALLALRGCRRITSALWPVYDASAPVFAECYYRELRACFTTGADAHRFSHAFKSAISNFRAHDHGRFDHEIFWAPYTFYGLG